MQLSTSLPSSESNLATLLLSGLCPTSLPASATTPGAGQDAFDFSQLLPSLASDISLTTAAPAAPASAPSPSGAVSSPLVAPSLAALAPRANLTPEGDAPQALIPSTSEEDLPAAADRMLPATLRRERLGARPAATGASPTEVRAPSRKSPATELDTFAQEALALILPPAAPNPLVTETAEFDPEMVAGEPGETTAACERERRLPASTDTTLPQRDASSTMRSFDSGAAARVASVSVAPFAAAALDRGEEKIAPLPGAEARPAATETVSPPARALAQNSVSPAGEAVRAFAPDRPLSPVSDPRALPFEAIAGSVRSDTAKIAVPSSAKGNGKIDAFFTADKSFLTTKGKRLTSHDADFGIGVAERPATMFAATPSTRAPSSALAHDLPAASVLAESGNSIPTSLPAAVEAASTAHRAVDVVLRSAEQVASREQAAVNLQFSIGGEDLAVRVELRANEVCATFHTDSPELRAVLSQEWQSVTGQAGERTVRLAAPVFAGSDAHAFSTSSGDTASQQRDSHARRAEQETASFSRASSNSSSSAPELAPAANRGWAGNSLHLHTVA